MANISIITASFNAGKTLADCIESVASQSLKAEHIVVDGASTDDTMNVVRKYEHLLARSVCERDRGMYDAMNKGIRVAQGEIIGILNADDFYPDRQVLQRVSEAFSDATVSACYGDLLYVGAEDSRKVVRTWIAGGFRPQKFYWGWMPPHPTFFVRRKVYEEFGGFNIEAGFAADYELMLRFLLKHKLAVKYIPHVQVHMRVGGVSNASLKNRLSVPRMTREAWRVNGLRPYPWTVLAKPLRKLPQWL